MMNEKFHKVLIALMLLAIGGGWVIAKFLPMQYGSEFNVKGFERLPVQQGGRLKPLDTVARNSLMILSGKQTIRLPEGKGKLNATMWLMDVIMRPEVASNYKVFRIDNADVLGLLGKKQEEKHFSYNELEPHFEVILKAADGVNAEVNLRTVYEQQVQKLYESLLMYNGLMVSFTSGGRPGVLELEYATWLMSLSSGMEAIRNQAVGEEHDTEALARFMSLSDRYLGISKMTDLGIVPPVEGEKWANLGQGLLDAIITNEVPSMAIDYAQLTAAYREANEENFNKAVASLHEKYGTDLGFEVYFNQVEPFYVSCVLYVMCFLGVCICWLWGGLSLEKASFRLMVLAFLVHTFGLIARMWISDRPPVTNLYSSAIFVGWAGVLIGILLERVHKNGLGTAVASLLGFATLIIAHNLGLNGDTLEMVRAVLDSNFWLSTHVVVVTLGYSAMFLMGTLGVVYLIVRLKPRGLDSSTGKNLVRMVYGVLAFAVIFSFVGTMLGGVWADQSWGRFWGWDPKENGALLIVLWCAVMLHARWGKLVGDVGFMVMAVFGNIVTSWSWFGTNMLGVGLHSYGFMDKAFWALAIFIVSQIVVMALGFVRRGK